MPDWRGLSHKGYQEEKDVNLVCLFSLQNIVFSL